MNKLIAIDLDGTLLNDNLTLSPLSVEVLRKLNEKGFIIVLATGRPFRALSSFYQTLGLSSPVICYNGALSFEPNNPSFSPLKKKFAVQDILSIFHLSSPLATSFMCETHRTIYRTCFDSYLEHYFPYKGMEIKEGSLEDNLKEDVYTAIIRSEKENDEKIKSIVTSHSNILYRHWTESPYQECFLKGADKGIALAYICEKLRVNKEDVYSFGDSNNDLEMLSFSAHPFAMKGSKSKHLKDIFPVTEDGNNDDGVAKTLQNLFLK